MGAFSPRASASFSSTLTVTVRPSFDGSTVTSMSSRYTSGSVTMLFSPACGTARAGLAANDTSIGAMPWSVVITKRVDLNSPRSSSSASIFPIRLSVSIIAWKMPSPCGP